MRLQSTCCRAAPLLALVTSLLAADVPQVVHADRWYAPEPLLGIVDAGSRSQAAHEAGASWDRILFLWQEIQPTGPDDWYLDRYVDRMGLRGSLSSGLPLVAVVQGTPAWAGREWRDGAAAVPTGLEYPVDDSRNRFGQFMLRLAHAFKGRVGAWVIWNEPDFLPGDPGSWWTWAGTSVDFFALLRTGYRAVKAADPAATVVFPATTYFADVINGRELFIARVLHEGERDRDAPAYGYYFDAVALNLYCSLDAVYRVYGVYSELLARYKLRKPLWLTETNCPIYNDASHPIKPANHITTTEQAAFVIQVSALARAAGYTRIGWFNMVDGNTSSGADVWGLVRSDGSRRPSFRAFQVVARYLGRPEQVVRAAPFGAADMNGWPLTRVIFDDLARRERVQVFWRTAAGPGTIHVEPSGAHAWLLDRVGGKVAAHRSATGWDVPLPPPRVPQTFDPPGFHSVGDPVLLIETELEAHTFDTTELPRVTAALPLVAVQPRQTEPVDL
jgi:polysaccharide biosynthesis protein PslG